jgi:SPP1 gp7 family putative phage head morphogenesis protein
MSMVGHLTKSLETQRMKYDPTKSKTLIRSYEAALKRRISRFWKYIQLPLLKSLINPKNYLKKVKGKISIQNTALTEIEALLNEYDGRFLRPKLKTQINRYIKQGYTKGAIRADMDLSALGIAISFEPFPIDFQAVGVLVDNNFSLVKNANSFMKKEMLRHISNGILEGKSIYKIQRDLRTTIKLTKLRATTIARTEIIRAYTQGAINQYKKVGVKKFKWICAYDDRTCERCASRDGKKYSFGEPQPPLHPGCRCTVAPIVDKVK